MLTGPVRGKCSAGNGAMQLAVTCRWRQTRTLPARLNTGARGGDLKAGPCDARDTAWRTVLGLSASQGGQNTAVLLGRYE